MKNKKLLGALFALGTVTVATSANAASIGDVAETVRANFGDIAELLKGGAYLGGVGFGISAALKFKEHNEAPQQVKLSQPVTKALVAGALLSLGTWMNVLTGTAVGGDANTTDSADVNIGAGAGNTLN